MKNKIIKFFGGYTEDEFKNKCKEFSNSFDEIPEDEIKVGDKVYFYYVSRIDYQTSRYHEGIVTGITNIENQDGSFKTYEIKCTDSKRFNRELELSIKDIALSKRKLRDKIMNSDSWTFLTYMSYHHNENRLPKDER